MPVSLPRRAFLQSLLAAAAGGAEGAPRRQKEKPDNRAPFLFEGGRILVDVIFTTPDGAPRKALGFFNMGMGRTVVSKELHGELGLDRGARLRYLAAGAEFDIGPEAVEVAKEDFTGLSLDQMFSPRKVEAILSPSVLRESALVIDYARRRIAIDAPGRAREGVAVPIDLNPETELASVDVEVAGKPHIFVVDAGSGYCWMRGLLLKEWLAAAPDWRRADGAIGRANYNMIDFAFEKQGTIARVPEMIIGGVALANTGMMGTGPLLGGFTDGLVGELFWDNWQKSAAKPVAGWLGANALQNFEITIDYPGRMSYWRRQSPPDPHDLDQPGLTLVRRDGRYFIGGLVRPVHVAPLEGAAIGDELIGVGGLEARAASKEALLLALHGRPGEMRTLRLRGAGGERSLEAPSLDLS